MYSVAGETFPYGLVVSKEGWALRAVSDKQSYLMTKFRMGETTGRKLDTEMVAREMRRARDSDDMHLFHASQFFIAASQVASFSLVKVLQWA